MWLEQKVLQIDRVIRECCNKDIVIWGAGRHTEQLFKYTSILNNKNIKIVDSKQNGKCFFGKEVYSPKELEWDTTSYVLISSYQFQNEIERELGEKWKYGGNIIKLYNEEDETDFYNLPSENDGGNVFLGKYKTWEEAEKVTKGYEEDNIVQKVAEATSKVVAGEAVYERDSCLFYEKQYDFNIVAVIGIVAKQKDKVNVLDFGGALGSSYWKNREILKKYDVELTWNIVEQSNYVKIGQEKFQNSELKFINTINDIEEAERPDVIIFSSVLQYINHYDEIIKSALEVSAKYIIVDRCYFDDEEYVCAQKVSKYIYEGSYPTWIFNEKKFIDLFQEKYQMMVMYDDFIGKGMRVNGKEIRNKGIIFEKI